MSPPEKDGESSGPFSVQESTADSLLKALERITVEPKSTKLFKGLNVGIPWAAVLLLAGIGAYYVFVVERDANTERDYQLRTHTDSLVRIEAWLQYLNSKIDGAPHSISTPPRGRTTTP